ALFYQPLINLKTNTIIGWEALLRWHHPQRGLLFPDEFIKISEETGIITRLTEWILRTACQQLKQWHNRGFTSFTMAVNLSAIEFQQPQLVQLVEEVILDTGLPTHSLELEITESIAMEDIEKTKQTLSTLSKMGVRISIDDFGTGYSSISYLRQFPCHTLKVDRSFIIDLGNSESADLVGKSVINLGQGLNLTVVAEGVETEEQLNFLRQAQCDKVQGYWFSEPKPADEIEALLIEQELIKRSHQEKH
ncbi:MAG: EAL domain-containing protein, partial [Cyanobacteria bacterium J06649_11]